MTSEDIKHQLIIIICRKDCSWCSGRLWQCEHTLSEWIFKNSSIVFFFFFFFLVFFLIRFKKIIFLKNVLFLSSFLCPFNEKWRRKNGKQGRNIKQRAANKQSKNKPNNNKQRKNKNKQQFVFVFPMFVVVWFVLFCFCFVCLLLFMFLPCLLFFLSILKTKTNNKQTNKRQQQKQQTNKQVKEYTKLRDEQRKERQQQPTKLPVTREGKKWRQRTTKQLRQL